MVDRLIGVGDQFAGGEPESLVEVDAGAEREDAGGDAGEQHTQRPAPARATWRPYPNLTIDSIRCLSGPIGGDVGFVLAAGVQQQRAQLVVLELALPLVGKR